MKNVGYLGAVFTVWRKGCCQEIESEVFAVLSVVKNCTEVDGSVVNGDPADLVAFGCQKGKPPAPAYRQEGGASSRLAHDRCLSVKCG
jgi:hypothetical protein